MTKQKLHGNNKVRTNDENWDLNFDADFVKGKSRLRKIVSLWLFMQNSHNGTTEFSKDIE